MASVLESNLIARISYPRAYILTHNLKSAIQSFIVDRWEQQTISLRFLLFQSESINHIQSVMRSQETQKRESAGGFVRFVYY